MSTNAFKARIIPNFPTTVTGEGSIYVEKKNGIYKIYQNPFYPLGDAPHDGNVYGRYNGVWEQVVTAADYDADKVVVGDTLTNHEARIDVLEESDATGSAADAAQNAAIAAHEAWINQLNYRLTANESLDVTQTAQLENKVDNFGDTMTGHLGLPVNPASHQAVRRDYVDEADTALNAAINAKVGEAPQDNNQYARKNAGWEIVVASGGGGGGIAEAPSDNKVYGRYNTTWVESVSKVQIDTADAARVLKAGDVMTGNLTISKASPAIALNKPNAGTGAVAYGQTNGVLRWAMALGDGVAETGGNNGSNFLINAYADNGAYLSTPISVIRSTGAVNLAAGSTVGGFPISDAAHVHSSSQVVDFSEAVDDRVAALLTPGANVTMTYNDTSNTLTIAATGGAGGGLAEAPVDGRTYARRGSDGSWRPALEQALYNPTSPAANGQLVIEATHNSYLTFKYRGTDGVVRIFEMPLVTAAAATPGTPGADFSDANNSAYIAAILEDF